MSFSGGRTSSSSSSVLLCSSSLVVLLVIISVLHIWVFSENRVEAIRVFPESRLPSHHRTAKSNFKQTEIFREYFKKIMSDLNSTIPTSTSTPGSVSSSHQNATFQETKRKVASCPDPLHNK